MKSRILLALLLNVSCCCMAQESLSVDSMLCAIRDKDQSIRQKIMPMLASGNQDSIMAVVVQMNMIDKENQTFVFGLLDNQGWPDGLSDKANSAIFLVDVHAEFAAQEKYYPVVKEKADRELLVKRCRYFARSYFDEKRRNAGLRNTNNKGCDKRRKY